ncbi:MAG: ATP synthase F1 subunit gamma, partial [Bacteroidetes bacterium]
MANLKEVRNRITSVSSTQQITSAMKMVSASKLRKAQNAVVSLRPYADKLYHILQDLTSVSDPSQAAFSTQREMKNVLIIAITSNRGLCGPFNSNVIKRVAKEANEKYKGHHKVSVISIGKKADDHFRKSEWHIFGSNLPRRLHRLYDDLTYENVASVAQNLMENYLTGDFDRVVLVYNRFKNASVQILTTEQFLPVLPPEVTEDNKPSTDYIFEPSKEEIVEELIPRSLKIQLYRAILESYAAEHGARMTAMHKATDNASDMIRDLKIKYNKARQAAITG